MTTKDKILVYGAGGVQGGAVASKLLKEGHAVHTIVRNSDKAAQLQEQGITAFVGDLTDASSLTPAHHGINKVFLVLPVDYDLERNRNSSVIPSMLPKKPMLNSLFLIPAVLSG